MTRASFLQKYLMGEKDVPLKRGRGSQKKTAVLVMAESSIPTNPIKKSHSTGKRVGHIKMIAIPDLKTYTEENAIKNAVDNKAIATTDASSSYSSLINHHIIAELKTFVMKYKSLVGKELPWVHISISNAKRSILDIPRHKGWIPSTLPE